MLQVKNKTPKTNQKERPRFLILQNLGLTWGLFCTSDEYNLILKFEVQTFGLERRVKVNSWIFCCFYQSQFFHSKF